MAGKIDAIPVGPRAITAYLTIKGAAKGIEFYKKAFGAKELMRWTGKALRCSSATSIRRWASSVPRRCAAPASGCIYWSKTPRQHSSERWMPVEKQSGR
jgi:hypothetical protein